MRRKNSNTPAAPAPDAQACCAEKRSPPPDLILKAVQFAAHLPEEITMHHDHSLHDSKPKPFWSSRYAIGLLILGGIAGYFLLTEHRAHFLGALPFLLLLACPLMHVFMHGGHGSGHADHQQRSATPGAPKTDNIGEQP